MFVTNRFQESVVSNLMLTSTGLLEIISLLLTFGFYTDSQLRAFIQFFFRTLQSNEGFGTQVVVKKRLAINFSTTVFYTFNSNVRYRI